MKITLMRQTYAFVLHNLMPTSLLLSRRPFIDFAIVICVSVFFQSFGQDSPFIIGDIFALGLAFQKIMTSSQVFKQLHYRNVSS